MKEIIFILAAGTSLFTGVPMEKVKAPIQYVANTETDVQTVAELNAEDNYYANYDISAMEKRTKETIKHIGEMSIADSEERFLNNLSAYVVKDSPAEKNLLKLYKAGNGKEVQFKIGDIEVFPEENSFDASVTIQMQYQDANKKVTKIPVKVDFTFVQKNKESVFMLQDAKLKSFF